MRCIDEAKCLWLNPVKEISRRRAPSHANSSQDKYKPFIYFEQLLGREKGTVLKRIPSFAIEDLANCCICGFQDRFEDILSPKRFNILVGLITVFLKMVCGSYTIFDKLINIDWVFWSLKWTKLSVPPLAILFRSLLREEIV